MKTRIAAGVMAALIALPVHAQQQQVDPAFLQKAIGTLQQQRNAALDGQASAEARAGMLADEVEKLKKQIEELAKKPAAPAQPEK